MTFVLQNKCSKRTTIAIKKTPIFGEKKPYYTCFSVKIRTFANQNLSLTKRSTKKRVFSFGYYLI